MKNATDSLRVRSRSVRRIAAIAALALGCASYRGTASTVQPSEVAREGGWVIVPHFPLVMQQGDHDCGAAALAAVLTYWGRKDNALLSSCAPNCSQASIDHIRKLYVAADVSLGVGAAALATSVVLFLTSPSPREKSPIDARYRVHVAPAPSGGFAALSGSF